MAVAGGMLASLQRIWPHLIRGYIQGSSPGVLGFRADDLNYFIQHLLGQFCWIAFVATNLHALFNLMPSNGQ